MCLVHVVSLFIPSKDRNTVMTFIDEVQMIKSYLQCSRAKALKVHQRLINAFELATHANILKYSKD